MIINHEFWLVSHADDLDIEAENIKKLIVKYASNNILLMLITSIRSLGREV